MHAPNELDALNLNVYICAIAVLLMSAGMLVLTFNKTVNDISSRSALALAAWLANWSGLLVLYTTTIGRSLPISVELLVDAFTSVCALACALLLFPKKKTSADVSGTEAEGYLFPKITVASYCICSFAFIASWSLLFGRSNPQDSALRQMAATPGEAVSMFSFFFLAYGAGRKFSEFAAPIWACGFLYGMLQFPAYQNFIIDIHPTNTIPWRLVLAIGKAMNLVTTVAIGLKLLGVIQKPSVIKILGGAIALLTVLLEFGAAFLNYAAEKSH